MQVLVVVLLFANAAFNVVVWPRFYPRIANDPRARDAAGNRTAFYSVHVALIVVAILLGVASLVAGVLLLL